MSKLYGPNHRKLQDRFDTRRLADGVERRIVGTEITPEHQAFIESREMFWLATIDHRGRPTVSYKGGDPGFVRVLDRKTIAFPCYDGNGMFYSMGNLLIDCEFRDLRRFTTTIRCSPEFFEALMIVRVSVTEIFRNCPRYVQQYKKITQSDSVPRPGIKTPLAGCKRVDDVQTELPTQDQGRAEREGGVCSREEYEKYLAEVSSGDLKIKSSMGNHHDEIV